MGGEIRTSFFLRDSGYILIMGVFTHLETSPWPSLGRDVEWVYS